MNQAPARRYDPISISNQSTVVAEYVPDLQTESDYESEADLERKLIEALQSQAYEYLPITTEAQLVSNLRSRLEALNNLTFSQDEWDRFFTQCIAGANDGIKEKTVRIQEDHVQLLHRDDGSIKNVRLIDKADIHNNSLQVINQYEVGQSTSAGDGGARRSNRYDVTVLVNGLPMVHIELKRRGVNLEDAFNQINRYQRDSFWAGTGLFEYVQLFVISNGTLTKYYSNTTRFRHLAQSQSPGASRAKSSARTRRTSDSYEFTSWWADANNTPIADLLSFAKTFFAKHSLLSVLTRYCVLTSEHVLMVMRPYQIVATERILQRIQVATNYKRLGTLDGGGYVWHTTGSGKTLTSFKTAQLASQLASVDKVLFVVDRKDLDYQTMKEYDKFQKGAANSNTSTAVLKRQLEDPAARIIVTTIQKLSRFIEANKGHAVYGGHIVIIFDECHRSQFGDMHTAITRAFKRYNLFGFTGTPIFAANASAGPGRLKTTEQAFGERLHTYTIVDAITDKNVLPFRLDFVNTVKVGNVVDKEVSAIDTERALMAEVRMTKVVEYVLEHFDQKTKRATSYTLGERRVHGFNALFACSSIKAARAYYGTFDLLQRSVPAAQRLKVGMIFSYGANDAVEDVPDIQTADGLLPEEDFDTSRLTMADRDYLNDVIADYNEMFGTSFDTNADQFANYYKDLSQRLKDREIDLVIVVNMFLTGFDATTLNTLFVDKNLRSHGLIQAFSRTNRILNKVKTFGNIVCFRDLEQATNDAIALFGNKESGGIVLLKPYAEQYPEYAAKVAELLATFPPGDLIVGEAAKVAFVKLFGEILRMQNVLSCYDEFIGNEILTPRQKQDYQSLYLDVYGELRDQREAEKEPIDDDLVFEIELIKQIEINVDYILMMVQRHRDEHGDGADVEIRDEISRAVASSPSLRNKRDLIEDFVASLTVGGDVDGEWRAFVAARMNAELEQIISDERLRPEAARAFVAAAFRDGSIASAGTAITGVLPPTSRFSAGGGHGETKQRVLDKLTAFYDRFSGLGQPAEPEPSA